MIGESGALLAEFSDGSDNSDCEFQTSIVFNCDRNAEWDLLGSEDVTDFYVDLFVDFNQPCLVS